MATEHKLLISIESAIDKILTTLMQHNGKIEKGSDNSNNDLFSQLINYLNLLEQEFIELCEILQQEYKYVRFQTYSTNNFAFVEITVRGRFFIENGGYAAKKAMNEFLENRINSLEESRKKREKITITLTLILAIGTGIAAIIEVLKFLIDYWY